jgi:hypothetical protein
MLIAKNVLNRYRRREQGWDFGNSREPHSPAPRVTISPRSGAADSPTLTCTGPER